MKTILTFIIITMAFYNAICDSIYVDLINFPDSIVAGGNALFEIHIRNDSNSDLFITKAPNYLELYLINNNNKIIQKMIKNDNVEVIKIESKKEIIEYGVISAKANKDTIVCPEYKGDCNDAADCILKHIIGMCTYKSISTPAKSGEYN